MKTLYNRYTCYFVAAVLVVWPGSSFSLDTAPSQAILLAKDRRSAAQSFFRRRVASEPREGAVRLSAGSSASTGRVEIYHGGEWGTVCGSGFGDLEASAACRALAYSYGFVVSSPEIGPGQGSIVLADVACTGDEFSLLECYHGDWGDHNCLHDDVVAIECVRNHVHHVDGAVRLVGGPDQYAGRVELYHDDRWGTLCGRNFGGAEARVVCRMLRLGDGVPSTASSYGQGSDVMWPHSVSCRGTEWSLDDCRRSAWGATQCPHPQDASVECGF